MIILMKFTSRGRYETLKRCVKAYYDMANNPKKMVWLFTIDNDDDTFQKNDFELFLQMRKNHGDEELKARDLFYAVWVPDLSFFCWY